MILRGQIQEGDFLMKSFVQENVTGITTSVKCEDKVFGFKNYSENEMSEFVEKFNMSHGSHREHSSD